MKQLIVRHFLATGLLLALLPAVLWGQDIPTIRVAAFNYYPAIFLDTDNQVRGFYVDMLDEIAAQKQIRFEYVFGSWNDGLERLRSGEVDLVTSAAFTEERATFMDFGQQVLLTVWGELYIPQDSANVSIRDLQDQPIAVMRGDHNARSFKEHLEKFGVSSHFIEFADFDEVFSAVRDQQVSAGVVNSVFGDAAAPNYQLQASGIAFNPFDIYFATAKGQNTELLNLLDVYLWDWRNDSASVYYQARLEWGAGQEPIEVIPVWVVQLAAVAILVFLSGLVFIALLRHRVNRATRGLQESNNMIRLLLDSTAEGIYGLDPQGICTFCNKTCLRMLGYSSADQIIGHSMHDLIHHSYADGKAMPASKCSLLKGLGKQIHSDREEFWRFDGSSFPVEYWSYPIISDNKNVGMVISFVDITERKKADEALRESEERFKRMFNEAPLGIAIVDSLNAKFYLVNPALARITGRSMDELLGIDWVRITHPDDIQPDRDNMMAMNAGKIPGFQMEKRYLHTDGKYSWVKITVAPMYVLDKSKPRHLLMVDDISERKKMEEALRESEERFKKMFLNHSAVMLMIKPDSGEVFDANHAAVKFYGYSREELLSFNISQINTLTPDVIAAERQAAIEENRSYFVFPHRLADGETRTVEVHSTPITVKSSTLLFSIVHDITDRKQAQLALEQKNQEIEQFVYSVSHDLKSPLVTVKTYASMLQQDLLDADRQQVNEDLDYINHAADKMQQLLDALLHYSRVGRVDTPMQTLSARQLVDNCLSSLAGTLQHHQVEVTTNELTQQLHGDPLHFGQIWQNLIENAVKYRGDQNQPQIEIGAMPQAEDVVFYVRDNGVGIAAEHSERIFNLFSQLHSNSDGSGLGLALVKKIVSIYQGRIWVESAGEGQGSCFMFSLPGAVVKQDKAR